MYGGGEFDGCEGRIRPNLMTPWNVCQNPSCYKKRLVLAQAANQTREIFATVTTRTSYAPLWLHDQKMQSLRWRDNIAMLRRVWGVVFASSSATRMKIEVF